MPLVTDEIKASASEMYNGNELCQEKSKFLLTEVGLPNGLLPMEDMEECGYVKDTGFVWLRSKKKTEHKFQKISKLVQYAPEVTAYVEQNRIKKLTGVKAKELLMWVTINEIYVDEPSTGQIHFKTPAGLSRNFPIDAFLVDETQKHGVKEAVKVAADAGPAAIENGVDAAGKKVDEQNKEVTNGAVKVKEV
ncbi:unnamed protein product [Coffea canephora]|uniref:DUF538 domain-containing protein n=2 Tax=Coffea TaxID=13442 RepID=A0A068V394_COFCA|nr:uncharacterized protein LOC113727819 [Coffea arabica]CDP15235.1 unnamed protein product [Coffea canephora]